MKFLDGIFVAAIVGALVAAPLLLFYGIPFLRGLSRGAPRKIGIVSLFGMAISVLVGFGAASTSQDISRTYVKSKLASPSDYSQISINGAPTRNPKEVLSVLKTLDQLPAHHSNPTKKIKIEVSSQGESLVLLVARDSGDPREYWVFYPKYLVTANNEIGRIKTSLFDVY